MGLVRWWDQQRRRRQQQGDGGRQGCRLTSRQTTVAAKIAAREVLMVCCQGDKDQPASVSFADANEGLRAPTDTRLSFFWRCRLKPLVPREWISKLHLSQRQRRRKTIHFLLSFFLCSWCASFVSLSPEKKGRLQVLSIRQPPRRHHPSLPIPSIPCGELAFSVWGADSYMRCWITALSRRNTPPQRQQKGRLLCLARGKHLGTDDAGPTWFTRFRLMR